jgi:hypothetical protein
MAAPKTGALPLGDAPTSPRTAEICGFCHPSRLPGSGQAKIRQKSWRIFRSVIGLTASSQGSRIAHAGCWAVLIRPRLRNRPAAHDRRRRRIYCLRFAGVRCPDRSISSRLPKCPRTQPSVDLRTPKSRAVPKFAQPAAELIFTRKPCWSAFAQAVDLPSRQARQGGEFVCCNEVRFQLNA